jgi:hypothetical protein
VEERLRAEGFKPFEVELGGRGVGLLDGVPEGLVEEFGHGVGAVGGEQVSWLHWS